MSRLPRLVAVGIVVAALLNQGAHAQNSQGAQGAQGGRPVRRVLRAAHRDRRVRTQSAQGDQAAATPTFRGGIDFVRVDVIVSDKAGNPIGDLSKATSRSSKTAKCRTSRPSSWLSSTAA